MKLDETHFNKTRNNFLGKTVKQYHEEKGERAQLINLGHFDKSKHIQWLKDNPSKVPKTAEFRKHVSHFYSDGDFCELSGKCFNRIVLVDFKTILNPRIIIHTNVRM